MGLPSPESARHWGGKLLVDRDGTEIGTCTEIFIDDATGLAEWAAADVSGGPALVPLLDATEAGDRVQVTVRQADIADAPSLGHGGHMSEDEEERLYRHYGIEVSREASESLLPAPEAEARRAPLPRRWIFRRWIFRRWIHRRRIHRRRTSTPTRRSFRTRAAGGSCRR